MAETSGKVIWTGRVLSGLVSAAFLVSAFMKLKGSAEVTQGMAHLGLTSSMVQPLAIIELASAVLYLIPMTAVFGAILLSGFMGGAICVHWSIGDPFYTQIALGVVAWLGLWLRDARLRALLPLRSSAP